LETLFVLLLFAFLIDGLKLIIESRAKPVEHGTPSKNEAVTVIIPAHNEKDSILATLRTVKAHVPEENIIVVDDESTDGTSDIIRNSGFKGLLLWTEHKGKVRAIEAALDRVKTKYILLLDADVHLPKGLRIPTNELESGKATAVAFNIVPAPEAKNWWQSFLLDLQKHEYAKSMSIGRRFSGETKSVHCISGAAGLFRTDRLKELSKQHTGVFPGEDLERTLIELLAQGSVIFHEQSIYTSVPLSFFGLAKQRIVGWWPGLWRNMWMFVKLLCRRKEPVRLRYEMIYELWSIVTDPFKLLGLIGLVIAGSWKLLIILYAVYLFMEIVLYFRIHSSIGDYLEDDGITILIYPIYSALQMVYRLLAFFLFIWKKFIVREWSIVAMLLLLVSVAGAQSKKDWAFNYQYSYVHDQPMDRNFNNHQFFVGWKSLYTEVSTDPYNRLNIGMYYGNWWGDLRYRWENQDMQAKLQYEYWFGDFVPYAMGGMFYQSTVGDAFPIAGAGISWYATEQLSLNAGAVKEWGRVYGLTYIGSARYRNPGGIWGTLGGSITNFGDRGVFGQLGYGPFYLHSDYYENYDFTTFDRMSFGAGLLVWF
jgi:glycosyltransferase involved in cell wall biosynthesis